MGLRQRLAAIEKKHPRLLQPHVDPVLAFATAEETAFLHDLQIALIARAGPNWCFESVWTFATDAELEQAGNLYHELEARWRARSPS